MCTEPTESGAHRQVKLIKDIHRASHIGVDSSGRITDLSYSPFPETKDSNVLSQLLRFIVERQQIAETITKKEYADQSHLDALFQMFQSYNDHIKTLLGL